MAFADNFINSYMRGQQSARTKRIEDEEKEDRGIEKDILAHRIKELKIGDAIRAREAARQNIAEMEGLPASQFPQRPFEMSQPDFSGGIPARATAGGGADVPTMTVPGIPELGVPATSRKPMTMEDILGQQLVELKQKAMWTPRTASRGGNVVIPGMATEENPEGVVASGDDYPEQMHRYVTRDASGKETVELLTAEEFRKRPPPVRQRLPSQGSGGGANQLGQSDRDAVIAGVFDGTMPPDQIPNTTEGLRIKAGLQRRGFNLTRAQNDIKAFRTYLSTLNQGKQQEILVASDSALDALQDLEAAIDSGGDRKPAIKAAKDALAIIKSGGSAPTNKALEDVEKELADGIWNDITGDSLKAKVLRLRTALGYRVASIRGSFTGTGDVTKKPAGSSGAAKPDPGGIR